MTHRQFGVWEEWQFLELNRPGLIGQLLMSVAAEVRRGYVDPSRRGQVKLEDMKLKFERKQTGSGYSLEFASKIALMRTLARVGGTATYLPPQTPTQTTADQ